MNFSLGKEKLLELFWQNQNAALACFYKKITRMPYRIYSYFFEAILNSRIDRHLIGVWEDISARNLNMIQNIKNVICSISNKENIRRIIRIFEFKGYTIFHVPANSPGVGVWGFWKIRAIEHLSYIVRVLFRRILVNYDLDGNFRKTIR
jgi:hypothetical protein